MGELMAFIVVASAVWVFFDARQIGVRKGLVPGQWWDADPTTWTVGTLLLWILFFPMYLAKRETLKERVKSDGLR